MSVVDAVGSVVGTVDPSAASTDGASSSVLVIGEVSGSSADMTGCEKTR